MSYTFYKVLHLGSIALILCALGGATVVALGGSSIKDHPARKLVSIAHGVGLLGALVGGFGLLARLGVTHGGLPGWVYAKVGLWLLIGATLAGVGRKTGSAKLVFFALPVLVAVGAWLAGAKPF
jgi:hypothetical protein